MENHDLELNEYDPKIFKAEDGSDPFQFALYIPSAAIEMTRTAADMLRTQLLNIIPGHNHEIHVVDDGVMVDDHVISVFPNMLLLRLDYLAHDSNYLSMQFSLDETNLVLH
jgi:hypothetical protein